MKKLLKLTSIALLGLAGWIPSTAQSSNAAAELAECKQITVALDHELQAAYQSLTDTTTALYRLREALPVQVKTAERAAERRGWKRGAADTGTLAGCVTIGATLGGLPGAGVGLVVGVGWGLVRKWVRG